MFTQTRATTSRHKHNPVRFLMLVLSTWHQRKTLSLLDDHMLRDIGITRDEAEKEAAQSLWDVPRHWTL